MGSLFKSPKAPPPLDVGAVTKQASAQNTRNAWEQAAFNRANQRDAMGNTLKYLQTGTDARGNPTFQVSQALGQYGQQAAGGLAGLGQKFYERAGQGVPDSSAAFNQAYDLASANLEPRFQRMRDAEINRLRNQGLDPTSEAYRSQMNDLGLQQNEARNNLVSNLQNQMFAQALQGRQQQMQELTPGVNAASQFMNPSYVNVPNVGVQNVDVGGLSAINNQNQWQNYNAQMQNRNAMLGGLAGIGGTLLGGPIGGALAGSMFGGVGSSIGRYGR